ncbi:MAG: radical SAM protein [Thermoplasmata archaeon]|nr:radical SAM protein [Thermoplasmata archaeon]
MKCKSALNKSHLYGLDYTINPYYGCSHACIYCYVPSLIGITYDEFRMVEPKENIIGVLRKEIRRKKRGLVGISTATDAYQPLEKRYELTRKILEILQMYGFPVDVQTKSTLVLRDIDILKKFDYASIGITITTLNEEIARKWEPLAPLPHKRLEAAKKLVEYGIYAYIFFGPIFPLMKREEAIYAMEEFINAGIKEIIVDKLHVKKGIEENIKKAFPQEYKRIMRNENFKIILNEMKKFEGKLEIKMAWE